MKRGILFMLALTLIGSSALAQGLPSLGSPFSRYNPPTTGYGAVAYPSGTSSGVANIYDPYGYGAVAAKFGTSSGVANILDPYGYGAVASRFGTSQGIMPR